MDRLLLLVLSIGLAFRILTIWTGQILWIGALYAMVGMSYAENSAILVSWPPVQPFPEWEHSLTYPLYLAAFYRVFGHGLGITQVASVLSALLLIVVGFWTTADLMGRTKGLFVASVVSFDRVLLRATSLGDAENMAALFFVLTLWSLLKAVGRPRYYPLVGACASGFYLTKTIMGPSFIALAIIGLYAWLVGFVRRSEWRNPFLAGGMVILVGTVSVREYMITITGRSETTHSITYLIANLDQILPYLLPKLLLVALILAGWSLLWWPELAASVRRWRQPAIGTIWVSVVGVSAATWLLISGFASYEPFPVFFEDNARYFSVLIVPILWAALSYTSFTPRSDPLVPSIIRAVRRAVRHPPLRIAAPGLTAAAVGIFLAGTWLASYLFLGAVGLLFVSPKARATIMLAGFLALASNSLTALDHPAILDAMVEINERSMPGDLVELQIRGGPSFTPSVLYPYLQNRDLEIVRDCISCNATFLLVQDTTPPPTLTIGYTEIARYEGRAERTWFAQTVYAILGREPGISPVYVALWQSNETTGR